MKLCIGIDPSIQTLSAWGLDQSAFGAADFAKALLAVAADTGCMIKPQVAYFEQFGAEGFVVLEELFADARTLGVPVLADAKRTDIGSTSAAYARAWFGEGAPMRANSLTATAYMGLGAIRPMIDAAHADGGQVFVVVRSSNPEGNAFQTQGEPEVWEALISEINELNQELGASTVGAVVGATQIPELQHCQQLAPTVPLLCPGLGAQGADMSELKALSPELRARMIMPISRGISSVGPDQAALLQVAQSWNAQLA